MVRAMAAARALAAACGSLPLARLLGTRTAAKPLSGALPRQRLFTAPSGGASATARAAAGGEAAAGGVYAPEIYDIAFGFRDFEKEVAFLRQAYEEHASPAPLTRWLELGCGPARHTLLVAATPGVADAVGLDLSPAMVAYAERGAAAAGVAGTARFLVGDMAGPGYLAALGAPVDLAACLLGSLAHCLDPATALRCVAAAAAAVRPGGLLVLELGHPEELFSGGYYDGAQLADAWEAPDEAGGRNVLVEWGRDGDEFDAETQVLQRTVGLSVYRDDVLLSTVVETVPQRQYTAGEVALLAAGAGFEVAALRGDFDPGVSLAHEEAYRMVAVLRRLGA